MADVKIKKGMFGACEVCTGLGRGIDFEIEIVQDDGRTTVEAFVCYKCLDGGE